MSPASPSHAPGRKVTVTAAATKPSVRVEGNARAWLRARSDAAFRGFLMLAVPSIVFVVAPLFFILIAVFHRIFGAKLAENGLLVPARLVDDNSQNAGGAWERETEAMLEQVPEEGAEVVAVASGVASFVGKLVPAVLVHYEFALGGKSYRVAKYMFTDETFYRDENGQLWAVVDARHPRFQHWLVCRPVNRS